MSNYKVIDDVGRTLTRLLKDRMKDDGDIDPGIIDSEHEIVLSSPEKMGTDQGGKLILFLYQISENTFLRDQAFTALGVKQQQHPPLVLDLSYLVVANTDDFEKDHILLGKVMQIFYDHGVLPGWSLQGDLAGSGQELRLVLCSLPFESIIGMWQTFPEQSYKVSLCCKVTPVAIDSRRIWEVKRVI